MLAIPFSPGSSRRTGSSGSAQGRSGEPSGLYAVITTPCSLMKASRRDWLKYGWHSTWLVAGLTLHLARTSEICSELKLDSPMSLTRPFSTSFSMTR